MAKQTINLKNKSVTRDTTSNYVNFNQLGKNKAGYQTQRIMGKGRKLTIETQSFVGQGGPIQKLLKNLSKGAVGDLGSMIAQTLNVTKPYKAVQTGQEPKVGDKVEVMSGVKGKVYKQGKKLNDKGAGKYVGADVTRTGVETRKATGADIVNVGSASQVKEAGSRIFSKTGREVVKTLEQQVAESKDPSKKAHLAKQLKKIKNVRLEKHSENLKGVSQIAGSFMEAFRRN